VDVQHSGGTTRVTINQKLNGGKWNGLGIYSLIAGTSYTVTVTSPPGPSSTSADAVKIAYLQDAVGYVAVGDSITFGSNDDIPADGIGYEPILSNLLPGSNLIANEGVGGVSSADGAAFISATLSKYPVANYYLVMYGTNDADTFFGGPTPSGMGLHPGNSGYSGSYKDNMQMIISAIVLAGKTPYIAKVPYTTLPRYSLQSIQEYNVVVDELVAENGIPVTPPDFYSWFLSHTSQLADGLHPNGAGYQSMANLWFSALP
jgi:lysophospholipase L1-like esterase